MPDKPTGRIVALIVLLIVVAAALRGYLPARDRVVHAETDSGRTAMVFVVVALTATLTLLAVAVIARLRDPRAVAQQRGISPTCSVPVPAGPAGGCC